MKKRLFILSFPIFVLSFLPSGAQTIENKIEQIRSEHDLMGGVVTIFCGDEVVTNVPFGIADLDRGIPVTDSTMFRIASVSKMVTTIALLQLYDQGLFSLDQDIGELLEFPVRNPNYPETPITPRMVLSHTSSIDEGETYFSFYSATFNQTPIPNLSEFLTPDGSFYSESQFLMAEPGTYYTYSNINFDIAGTLVEKLSGIRFDNYCREHILIPLGIAGSFNVNDISNLDNLGVLYKKLNGIWIPQNDNYQGIAPGEGNLTGYIPGTNATRCGPDGGLRISGEDMAKIMRALMHQGTYDGTAILQDTTVNLMLSDQWTYNGSNGPSSFYCSFRSYGLGIHRYTPAFDCDAVLSGSSEMFGHTGSVAGLISYAYIDTIRNIGFVFMTNGCGVGYEYEFGSAYSTMSRKIFEVVEEELVNAGCVISAVLSTETLPMVNLFPNPTSSELHVTVSEKLIDASYKITNVQGQVFVSGVANAVDFALDLSSLPPGMYFFLTGDANNRAFKIVKQ